jgi:hypothetical protein
MQMHHNISGFVMNPWQLTKSGFGVPGDGFLIPPPPLSKHEDKFWDEMAIAFVPWERHYQVKNCLGVQVLIGKAGKLSKGNPIVPKCCPSVLRLGLSTITGHIPEWKVADRIAAAVFDTLSPSHGRLLQNRNEVTGIVLRSVEKQLATVELPFD